MPALKAKKRRRTRGQQAAARAGLASRQALPKVPSGIRGLDEITAGGLPRGRPTLVCGGPGCGKTLFAMEFLVRGVCEHGEPGVFMAFEETEEELAANVASLGFDIKELEAKKKLLIDYVRVERSEIEETGEYDLEGLFVRLQLAIETVGAKRVVLDTIESLFVSLPNPLVLRSELRRLFHWLKHRGMTVVMTGEKGEGSLTREGLEEYVSDCVIFLDHRVNEQISTRRLRIVKYRGSVHGTNEYPFLIDENGFSIFPVTSLGLNHRASTERIPSGIPRLDEMLGGKGYFKGSTILVTGTAGTGKTSLAILLATSACERGERCLYFAYEESTEQIVRNMRSIGIRLEPHIHKGLLRILASRPTTQGLEMHLVSIHREVDEFGPEVVLLDPITSLVTVGTGQDTKSVMTRLIDFLKNQGTTTCFTSLTSGGEAVEESAVGISSLIDTWLLLQVVRSGGERNRTLTVIKSRGMAHSNQTAEYRLSDRGFELLDTYLGPTGVVTGSARLSREADDRSALAAGSEEIARKEQERERRRSALERQITDLREQFESDDSALSHEIEEAKRRRDKIGTERAAMARSRQAFASPGSTSKTKTRRPDGGG